MSFWNSERLQRELPQGRLIEPYDGARIKHGAYELSLGPEIFVTADEDGKEYFAFPGKEEGTLGKHVYDIHRDPRALGIDFINQTSLQLLHVAGHIDAIESRILVAIREGRHVVLDRFWWSTWVYGVTSGAKRNSLRAMIALEMDHWANVRPAHVFLLRRGTPFGEKPTAPLHRIAREYEKLATLELDKYPVTVIANNRTIQYALREILRHSQLGKAADCRHRKASEGVRDQQNLPFDVRNRKLVPPQVYTRKAPFNASIVYETYWRFAAERQAIFFRRADGEEPPWTEDEILRKYKFTNAYRASDRVSQFLIRQVIYEGDSSCEETFFRTLLFKIFNRIETWKLLSRELGEVAFDDYSFARYDRVLMGAKERGEKIYSAAYIMPSGGRSSPYPQKHRMHLKMLERMMEEKLPARIAQAESMKEAFALLRAYPTIGDFLAYQFIIDLNYSNITNFGEMEFVVPGPGARDGIRKCFHHLGGWNETDIIRFTAEHQEAEFKRLGLTFRTLWGRRLQLVDCQSLFCEVDKYARLKHPEFCSRTGRLRIKQFYRPTCEALHFWYPPKWGLNDRIESEGIHVPPI